MKKHLNAIKFSIAMLPVAIIGGLLVSIYQFDLYGEEITNQIIAQMGSYELAIIVAIIQTVILTFLCTFSGYILADKVGLVRSFSFTKEGIISVVPVVLILGIIFSLDYWTFGAYIEEIAKSYSIGITTTGFLAGVIYGGIIEEILLRLLLMSLLSFGIWKLFFGKFDKENIPAIVFVLANAISALLFAIGHLPATITAFGGLTPLIIFRCFLLNGGFGFYFGYVYHKHGIQYAMLAHAGLHIISKLIWIIFI